MLDGPRDLALAHEEGPQVEVGRGHRGVDAENGLELRDRLVHLPGVHEVDGMVELDGGVSRVLRDGPVHEGVGFALPAGLRVDGGQARGEVRVPGAQLEGLEVARLRVLPVLLPGVDVGEVLIGLGNVGGFLDDLLEPGLGLVELLGTDERDRLRELLRRLGRGPSLPLSPPRPSS